MTLGGNPITRPDAAGCVVRVRNREGQWEGRESKRDCMANSGWGDRDFFFFFPAEASL